jgi:hypothetical protein
MKRIVVIVFATTALLGAGLVAGITTASAKVSGIKDGPYPSMSPDSTQCGTAWAIDTYNRDFTIEPQNNDGTWTVIESFDKGHILTLGDGQSGAAESPGACNGQVENSGHTLKGGIPGTFKGTETLQINTGAAYQGTGGCALINWGDLYSGWGSAGSNTPGDCVGTSAWVTQHFGNVGYSVTSFHFVYKAHKQTYTQDGADGESGDIFTGS